MKINKQFVPFVRKSLPVFLLLLCSFWVLTAKANESQKPKELRVSVAKAVMETGVIQALAQEFERLNPGVSVHFKSMGAIIALDDIRNGLADASITHHAPEEKRLVAQGYGLHRTELMYSEYALFGPPSEITPISGRKDIVDVLRYIARNEESFLEPSPRGGTYRKIRELWVAAGVNPDWLGYENTGTSALNALRQASEIEAFAMAEVGTFMRHRQELGDGITLLFRDDLTLRNTYSVVVGNADKVEGVNQSMAEAWLDFLVSSEGQTMIQDFNIEAYGTTVLRPAAHLDQGLSQRRTALVLKDKTRNIRLLSGLSLGLCILLATAIFLFIRIRKADRLRIALKKRTLIESHAREVAERANEAKSQFLANMSHEMRTPLTAIMGFTEILLDDVVEDKDRMTNAAIILKSSSHLLRIINNILDLSKIEAKKLEVQAMEFSLMDLLPEIEASVKLQTKEKGLDFKVYYNLPMPTTIHSDPLLLKQILINLCSNAVKFTHSGSVTIDVRFNSQTAKLIFEIIDTGIGISEADANIIFNAFSQADISDTRHYGGTGLGLSISKQLAEKLGGSISVSSQLDVGSTFTVVVSTNRLYYEKFRYEIHGSKNHDSRNYDSKNLGSETQNNENSQVSEGAVIEKKVANLD